jgi:hypothetical protein
VKDLRAIDRYAALANCACVAFESGESHSKIEKKIRMARATGGQRLIELISSFVEASQIIERAAEIVVIKRGGQSEPGSHLVVGDGLGRSSDTRERIGAIIVGGGQAGIVGDGLTVSGDRLLIAGVVRKSDSLIVQIAGRVPFSEGISLLTEAS